MNDTLPFYQWDSIPAATDSSEFVWLEAMDSLFSVRPASEVRQRPSLFREHSLQPSTPVTAPQPANVHTAPWLFVTLILLTALLCLYYRIHKIQLKELLTAIVDVRTMDRMLRTRNMSRSHQLFPMGVMIALVTAAALCGSGMLQGEFAAWHIAPFAGYLLVAAALTAGYLLRNGLMRLLGTVFDGGEAVNLYLTSNYLYHLVLTTVALPLLFLVFYLPTGGQTVLYALAGVAVAEFLARVARGLKVFLTQSSSAHFYLFYYLCIAETAPIIVIVKCFIG